MKKILALIVLVIGVKVASAQAIPPYLKPEFVTLSPRNLVNTDTLQLSFNKIGSGLKSLQMTVVKVSGTVAGKVYLYGVNDGIAPVKLDSLTLADVATPQTQYTYPAGTKYATYYALFITSGTVAYTPYFSMVRRPDER